MKCLNIGLQQQTLAAQLTLQLLKLFFCDKQKQSDMAVLDTMRTSSHACLKHIYYNFLAVQLLV